MKAISPQLLPYRNWKPHLQMEPNLLSEKSKESNIENVLNRTCACACVRLSDFNTEEMFFWTNTFLNWKLEITLYKKKSFSVDVTTYNYSSST